MDHDAIIIGTGQAGPSLARRLAGAGMKVAIVERGRFGGTCVNTGCTPTKTLVASAYAALGQPELALRHFDWVARDDFAHVPEDIVWMSEMLSLADAAVALNDAPRARLIYDKLAPHGDVFAVFAGGAAPAGPVAYTLGMLATTLQDYERAARWLAKAQALNQRVGAHLFTQICALAEARLIFRAWPWEAPRARALLDASCSFAEQRGIVWMRYYADNVRSEAPRDGGGVRIGLPRLREAR